MEHFVELALELLFGLSKDSPQAMPKIDYVDSFVVKHPRKKPLKIICATLSLIVVFSSLWIFVKHETRVLFSIFIALGVILLTLSVYTFSFRCFVNEAEISKNVLWISKKKFQWKDVQCVQVVEQTNEKTVIIALYDKTGKCVIDFNTDMENVWYIVKMAEHKSINIKHEKDLSIKQLLHL